MNKIVWEHTKVYRDIFHRGKKPGIEEALQQSRLASLTISRQLITSIVQLRFADLLPELQEKIAQLNDLGQMRELSIRISTAQNADEVKAVLETL